MSTPTAKDLLAQADRLMRQRTPEELPVLTDLVIEEIEHASPADRTQSVSAAHQTSAWAPTSHQSPPAWLSETSVSAPLPMSAASPSQSRAGTPPTDMRNAFSPDMLGVLPTMKHEALRVTATDPTTVTAVANVRDQFNAQLLTKLEELQHGVYSQVMQQLEIYAAGSLKDRVRDMLLPVLTDMARDIAAQVADDTSNQVREVVSKAVDSEIARLREQLSKRRMGEGRN
jgi:hypothetical protein